MMQIDIVIMDSNEEKAIGAYDHEGIGSNYLLFVYILCGDGHVRD